MKNLPELGDDSVVRVSRQGGVAAIHSLSRPREIEFAQCDITQRSQICSVLKGCLPLDSAESGRGDQRFYQIEVRYNAGEMVLKVPEDQAPGDLVNLWDTGQLLEK
ncbi:hypothetical protein GIW70_06375 [Pseudomonas syringae]|nr:hypothetical protein [Pseudomonas syringae]MCF5067823.1 hypothetical protein [Pseudomonas syringae]